MDTTGTKLMTLEEFEVLPEGPPYYEFEEGEVILAPSATAEHQDIIVGVGYVLQQFVRAGQLGRVFVDIDVYLPDGRVYVPDISFLSADHLHLLGVTDRKIHGVPDLVVEVTSSVPGRDRVHKFRVYYRNGVPWYWIIDSLTLAIEEYHVTPQGYLRTASVAAGEEFHPQRFAGLALNLTALLGITPPPPPVA